MIPWCLYFLVFMLMGTFLISDDERDSITSDVRNYWKTLRNYNSRSQFDIAKNAYDVIDTIINRTELVVPVSVVLEGEYGENNVAMGVPVKIVQNRISEIKKMKLNESILLMKSSDIIRDHINSI